ncbi:hypothetical protein HY095_05210 [Candidatus Micrarchaeota archaeon]|nr:hypothetical protein [Candidatus Micrarchaeota archaeon]
MFRGYDIRGVFGSEVTPEKFRALGEAMNSFAPKLVEGMDFRQHNQELFDAFCQGFCGEILFLGHAPTPAVSFNSFEWGMAITASHNPAEYAGAKFFAERHTAFEGQLKELSEEFGRKYAGMKTSRQTSQNPPKKTAEVFDAAPLLKQYAESLPEVKDGLFDLSGGAACAIKEKFPERIFDVADPRFESHSPEPKEGTLDELKAEAVRRKQVGFAFDGDADRVMTVDRGKVIDGGIVAAFICENFFSKKDGIVLNIDFTQEVKDYLRDRGFKTIICPVGTTNVVTALFKHKAAFGAERNGHYYFTKHLPDSDGIYAACLLSGTKPGELREFSEKFTNSMLTGTVGGKVDFAKLASIVKSARGLEKMETADGVHAVFKDFILLIRESQTEPKVRINSEGKEWKRAKEGMKRAKELLKAASA